jgi:SatD family (SatD)
MGEIAAAPVGYLAVLGDVVRSRDHADREDLQRELREALELANTRSAAVQPLALTIGDEFQGLYRNLADALEATLSIRLSLHQRADVRFGIGWGPLTTYDEDRAPFEQDGPAWWAAREAIERVREIVHQREMPRGVRSVLVTSGPDPGAKASAREVEGLVNAFLLCRDELVASMSARDAETMRFLLEGESPSAIAERQGVSLSAVSQRSIRAGLYALRAAQRELEEAFQ